MADILPFKRPVKKSQGLCQHGYHKWVVWQKKPFDVRQGKLVTVYRCQRCGKQKVEKH